MRTRRLSSTGLAVPTLETPRLLMRAWNEDDVADYMQIVGDPEVMRYIGEGWRYRVKRVAASLVALVTDLEARRAIAQLIDHWRTWDYGEWAVEEKATGALIGQVGLVNQTDWVADVAKIEVGWLLARRAWGRGLASEAGRASLAYGFEELGLERMIGMTRPPNRAAVRAMERIGLSFVGQTFWKGGDVLWHAVDRATWERQRSGTPEYVIVRA